MSEFWTAWPDVMRKKLGAPARKISIDAGFTCPNRDGTVGTGGCIFCSNEAFSPSVKINQLSIEEQIRKSLIRFRANGKKERYLAFFQPFSNTHAPVDKLEELYSRALQVEGIDGLIVSTRPDCVDAPKAELLKKLAINHYVSLELGVQSIYEESLTWMNRGHDYSAVKDAISLFADSQIDICLHVILGLPGEGGESAKA
ncbi:MAG: TIGR01212 family radical SAM protein, partial [Fibrobacteres bacterium]|nr:TIGR01212 family radical SAM protein [Fibrobacterota bacterium]